MAEYRSKYKELTFYVDGTPRKFTEGVYVTDDKKEIEVLDKLIDVAKIDKPEEPEKQESKTEVKETSTKTTTRKTSGK